MGLTLILGAIRADWVRTFAQLSKTQERLFGGRPELCMFFSTSHQPEATDAVHHIVTRQTVTERVARHGIQ